MKAWHWILLAVIAVGTVIASYVDDPEHFPAFNAVFGFLGAVILLLLAKAIGKKFLMRKEDYYDEH